MEARAGKARDLLQIAEQVSSNLRELRKLCSWPTPTAPGPRLSLPGNRS